MCYLFLKSQIILFKYCADVENCESFKGFGFIYLYIFKLNKIVILTNGFYLFLDYDQWIKTVINWRSVAKEYQPFFYLMLLVYLLSDNQIDC